MSLNTVQIGNDKSFVTTSDGYVLRPESAVTLLQRSQITYILPRNSVQATTLQGGTTDIIFDIPHNQVDFLDCPYLSYTLTNNDNTNALGLIDAFTMIDYITLNVNGEDTQTLYGYAIRQNILCSYSTEKLAQICVGVGINPATMASNVGISNNASQSFKVPLHTLMDRSRMPLWRPETTFRLTIRWLTGSQITLSTSTAAVTSLTISNVQLNLDGCILDPYVRAQHDSILNSGPKTFRFLEGRRDQLSFGNVTSGTITQQGWTGSGFCAFSWIWFGSATAANESLYNSLALSTFDILDNGLVVNHQLGDNRFGTDFMKVISTTQWTNTLPFGLYNLYYTSWSDQPVQALANGSNWGSYRVKGSTMQVRVNPAFSNASTKCYMYGMFYSSITVNYNTGSIYVSRAQFA